MAVVMIQDSEQITQEMYDEVTEKVHVHEDPPHGLIVHTAGEVDGRFRIVDVWESRGDFESFGERLGPAIAEVAQKHGVETGGAMAPTVYETHDMLRG